MCLLCLSVLVKSKGAARRREEERKEEVGEKKRYYSSTYSVVLKVMVHFIIKKSMCVLCDNHYYKIIYRNIG